MAESMFLDNQTGATIEPRNLKDKFVECLESSPKIMWVSLAACPSSEMDLGF